MVLTRIARTKESFKDKVSMLSESSQDSIIRSINNFENFCMEKYGMVDIIPDLKKLSEEEIYDTLQSWINWNSSKAPSSVLVYFSRLRKYLHYMGIKLHDQDVKAELNFKHKVEEELYGLTLQDIQSIFKEMRYKNKVQYMCQLSSLMRIGETVQLRKKNLILGQKNIIVKIPAMITKFNRARTTFFSKEATRLLLPLLKEMDDDDLVFGTSDNPKLSSHVNNTNSQSATKQVLRLAVKKAGLTMKYESTGRYMINTHSFRAYGITKLSRLDVNFAKKIAGQKGYLLQYDRLTDEEKLDLYEKFESELTIDDNAKQKAEIEQFQNEKSELQKFKNDMELKSKFQNDEATRHLEKQGELYKMILDLKREVGELKKSKK